MNARFAGAICLLLATYSAAAAQTSAVCDSVLGKLVRRSGDGKWVAVAALDKIDAGTLVVALPEATLVSPNGGVKVKMLADVGQRGPLPVLESALRPETEAGADFAFTLDRGIAVITNLKKDEAKVQVRIQKMMWTLTLEPDTVVGMERFERLPPGARAIGAIIKDGFKEKETPNVEAVMLVIKGSLFCDTGSKGFRVVAPPGNARVGWNNVTEQLEVTHVAKVPDVVRPPDEKELALLKEIAGLSQKPLDELWRSDSVLAKRLAVTTAGALDLLPQLVESLEKSPEAEVRQQAILVMRHWLGRDGKHVETLYRHLVDDRKMPPVLGRTMLQLLVGFDAEERREPGTVLLLLGLLGSKDVAVRELAAWHLRRLMPDSKDFAFDAAGPEAQRQAAVERWRKLIKTDK